jgi:DNA repair protein RecO (recombination protein O)
MPSYKTTGIVIGRTNLGEADRIIRFLTADHGKLSAVARGVRKQASRSGGHLELFGEVNLVLAKGRGSLDVVTSARLGWYPHQLTSDYAALGLAYAFAGAIDRMAQEHHAQPELYGHLAEALRVVNTGATSPLVELWFKVRLLNLAGFRPELTACMVCGQADAAGEYRFDAARGGLVCAACATALARPMSTTTVKLWRLLSDYPYATIHQVGGGIELAVASLAACDEFYEHHVGRVFRRDQLGGVIS